MDRKQQSVYLDVDPSLIEDKVRITEESQMEKEINNMMRDPRSKLAYPFAGFCVKTHTKQGKKLFVNICKMEEVPAPRDITSDELMRILSSEKPSSYRVPMSIGEGRVEYVKSGRAVAYDVAINPNFYNKIVNDNLFKTFLLTVVFEGLQDKYQSEIDTQNYVILQNKRVMGKLQAHRIQIRDDLSHYQQMPPKPMIEEIPPQQCQAPYKPVVKEPECVDENKNTKVQYRIRKESLPGKECFVVAEFRVPHYVKVEEMRLEVGSDRVHLTVDNPRLKDTVDFYLPCSVYSARTSALVDRRQNTLLARMPLRG